MNDFYIGFIVSLIVIVLLEKLNFLEKRLVGALTLTGIAFIYIGFSWHDVQSLILTIAGAVIFLTLSYFGYRNNFILIVLGLILHGIWDVLFPLFSSSVPEGYDVFCITIDFILALYFFTRVRPLKRINS